MQFPRVFLYIPQRPVEVFLRADEAIPIFPLPERPGTSQMFVDPMRGEAFPAVNDITKRMISDDPEKDVYVVRHHDE